MTLDLIWSSSPQRLRFLAWDFFQWFFVSRYYVVTLGFQCILALYVIARPRVMQDSVIEEV